jgi:signal transduction histidine kinase
MLLTPSPPSSGSSASDRSDSRLHLSVRDDGVGGADPARGPGLIGLTDRVQALGGTITVHSPTSQGTGLQIDLPVEAEGD